MKLFANGCSFTFGGGNQMYNNTYTDENGIDHFLDGYSTHPKNIERLSITWPMKLAERLGATHAVNLSQGGSGNARIVRTTLDYFFKAMERGEDLSDYVAVIQWSEISRREFYDVDHWANYNFNFGYHVDCIYDKQQYPRANSEIKGLDNIARVKEFYYKHMQSDEQDISDFITQVTALGGFFEKMKIRYVFCSHLGLFVWAIKLNDTLSEKRKSELKTKLDHLNNLYVWFNDDLHMSAMIDQNLDPCVPGMDQHPSILGNKQFADILYDWIEKKDILKV